MNKKLIKIILCTAAVGSVLVMGNVLNARKEELKKSDMLLKQQQEQIQIQKRKISNLKFELRMKEQKNKQLVENCNKLKSTLDNLKSKELISVGQFQITNYTLSPNECTWKPGHTNYGITASGKRATEGVTVAADWSVLPKGTKIYIEGIGIREVQDTGNLVKGNVIDVFVGDPQVDRGSQSRAKSFGRQVRKVWIINEAI